VSVNYILNFRHQIGTSLTKCNQMRWAN